MTVTYCKSYPGSIRYSRCWDTNDDDDDDDMKMRYDHRTFIWSSADLWIRGTVEQCCSCENSLWTCSQKANGKIVNALESNEDNKDGDADDDNGEDEDTTMIQSKAEVTSKDIQIFKQEFQVSSRLRFEEDKMCLRGWDLASTRCPRWPLWALHPVNKRWPEEIKWRGFRGRGCVLHSTCCYA